MGRHRSRSMSPKSPERSSQSSKWDGSSGHRLHVSDLAAGISRREVERAFEKYGSINEVWVATNPPCFAFINFTSRSDAEKAIREMDGKIIGSNRVSVSWARDRTYGGRNRGGRGGRGGSRGAPYGSYRNQRRSRSRSRSNSRREKRRHSRSRSPDRRRRRSVSPRDRKRSRHTSNEKNGNDRRSHSHHAETADENNTQNQLPLPVDDE